MYVVHWVLLLDLVTVKWFCSSESNSVTTLDLNFLKAILVVLKSVWYIKGFFTDHFLMCSMPFLEV